MTEISPHEAENTRRERAMSRAESIRIEMASGVRLLGSEGRSADEQNHLAARLSGLPVSVVERLRWKKIKRPFADVTDAIRDAVDRYNAKVEARERHERETLRTRIAALEAYADHSSDPEFLRAQAAGLIEQARRYGLLDSAVAEADPEILTSEDET